MVIMLIGLITPLNQLAQAEANPEEKHDRTIRCLTRWQSIDPAAQLHHQV